MEEKQMLDLLIQGVNIGQAKGCYTLQDSANLFAAVQYASNRIKEIENEEREKQVGNDKK